MLNEQVPRERVVLGLQSSRAGCAEHTYCTNTPVLSTELLESLLLQPTSECMILDTFSDPTQKTQLFFCSMSASWLWTVCEETRSRVQGKADHEAAHKPVSLRYIATAEEIFNYSISLQTANALRTAAGKDLVLQSSDSVRVACHKSRLAAVSATFR